MHAPLSDWERALRDLVVPQSAPGRDEALGLEVWITDPSPYGPPSHLRARPVRRTSAGEWTTTGTSWRDVAAPGARQNQQRALLAAVHRLAGGNGSPHTADSIPLASFGPLVWPLLRRAVAAGVSLVAGKGLSSVSIGDGAVRTSLDVIRTADGDLRLGVLTEGTPTFEGFGRSFLVGDPAHGFARLQSPGVLTLWPLAEPPADGVPGFVERGPLTIPAEDADRFLALYYPALARQGVIASSAGSVAPMDVPPPRLRLELAHGEGHQASLAWYFAYGAAPVLVAIDSPAESGTRDVAAEQSLMRAVVDIVPDDLLDDVGALCPRADVEGLALAPLVTTTLPRLREAGVQVVERGDRVEYARSDEPPAILISTKQSSQGDWFDLDITVTVAGQTVPFRELFIALAAGDDALLLDSGLWFSLDQPDLQALRRLIDEARELTDDEGDGLHITAYQASIFDELESLGVITEQSDRWRSTVGALLAADTSDELPPPGLLADLRPYQVTGFRWLSALWDAHLGGVLADDMGLGKTVQTVALFERARAAGQLDGSPVLVVAPASVVGTWVDEAARFAPQLDVRAVTATRARRGEPLAQAMAGAHVVVTSYTLLRLEDAAYRDITWSGLVLDEAQFVKNHRSRTYAAARKLGAPFTLAITGTPLENSLMDFWSLTSLAAPGLFPRPGVFKERFRKPIEDNGSAEALETLRRRVRPFMLRRSKKSVVRELPDKVEQVLHVELSPVHREVYEARLNRERTRVLGMLDDLGRNRVAIFRALTSLRQLALDPRLVDDHSAGPQSAKIESLVEQLQELAAEGHRALVFSSFTSYLALVREALDDAGLGHVYLDGRTRDRQSRIAQFREGTDPVFLISLKAGGFGLTLTEADYVFVLDPWWNPAAENQAVDRTHRIGQTRAVNVYRMVSVDTIEEKVVALQERKRDLFTSVVDSGDFASGAITADDIRDLFD